jgi:hypothetical protein
LLVAALRDSGKSNQDRLLIAARTPLHRHLLGGYQSKNPTIFSATSAELLCQLPADNASSQS